MAAERRSQVTLSDSVFARLGEAARAGQRQVLLGLARRGNGRVGMLSIGAGKHRGVRLKEGGIIQENALAVPVGAGGAIGSIGSMSAAIAGLTTISEGSGKGRFAKRTVATLGHGFSPVM
jgi:hypothetical protein